MARPRRVFIFGCHRTGTTLMRLVLDSHPQIHCFDEWKCYEAVLKDEYLNSKNAPIVGLKMPNWTEWVIESEHYRKFYNGDPIIFMMRDVRATIASMLKLPTGRGCFFNGVQNAIDVIWPADPHRRFRDECTEEIKRIEADTHPTYRKAAFFWKYKTSKYLEMVKLGWPVLPIHYEMLVHSPAAHLKIISQFLDIPWDENLLGHHQLPHDEVFNGLAVGNTAIDRPIDTSSTWQWKDIFTEEQEAAVLETASEWNDYVSTLAFAEKLNGS
jgi:hypothetical protein